jgi:hypothetical protein
MLLDKFPFILISNTLQKSTKEVVSFDFWLILVISFFMQISGTDIK